MKWLIGIFLIVLEILGVSQVMGNSGQIEIIDHISGSHFVAVLSATDIAHQRNWDLNTSTIHVLKEDASLFVAFLANKDSQSSSPDQWVIDLNSRKELTVTAAIPWLAQINGTKDVAELSGSSVAVIETALGIFRSHGLDVGDYQIDVIRQGESFTVIFADKDRPQGTVGSVGKPGFEVELNRKDLSVLRSNFVR